MTMEKINDRLYSWASDRDTGTLLQAERTARLSIVHDHVALMPDAHVGVGATVGSVIPTESAIIPAAVGVDIGCGMMAVRINKDAESLPDSLERLLAPISQAIPAGVGEGHTEASDAALAWMSKNTGHSTKLDSRLAAKASTQFGSLGSGNHFFEVCLDENDQIWIVLHSGSRGIGNQLAQIHINKAKQLARDNQLGLEDPALAYFTQDQPEFQAYIADMLWAQDYAMANRETMMQAALKVILKALPVGARSVETINCHHNFTVPEWHGDRRLWITRKGAIRAEVGDRGVIPGSMGTASYIVRGLGNEASWKSCSHGAGRRMSRGEARRTFTKGDLEEAMVGKAWQTASAKNLIDEIPASYKDIDQVMADQSDLVQIEHTLHQVLNYKGTK